MIEQEATECSQDSLTKELDGGWKMMGMGMRLRFLLGER